MKLTEKQKRFCEEYLIDLNGTQAYIRTGYSAKKECTARVESSKLLTKPNIQAYISELRESQSERTEITADKVLAELAAIAFTDHAELVRVIHKQITDIETGTTEECAVVDLTDTDKLSAMAKKSISGIKRGKNGVEVSSYDKIRALELIGKHIGMFNDKKDESADTLAKLDEVLNKMIPGGDK